MRIARFALLAVALAASAVAVQAYKLNGPKWAIKQVPYYINPVNSDVSESAAIAAIQAGAMTWSAQSNADIAWYYMGRTSGSSVTNNGRNEIFFRNESDGGVIARTYWWYNGRNELVDSDVLFYDAGWQFFTGSSGCSSGFYIEDITAHELGHALGLGHSSESGATMYGSATRCSTAFRTLEADDLAGIEKLYPPTSGSDAPPAVAISAPATSSSYSEGTTISFGGSASDKEDGSLSSKLAWSSSRDGSIGTGASFSRTLTVGTHTITARVTDSAGQTASSQISVTVSSTTTNTAPSVSIVSPADKATFTAGTTVTFSGSASDKEDGSLTSKLVWSSSVDGPLGIGGTVKKALTSGTHTVTASVTDSGGLSTSRQVTVSVTGSSTAPSGYWLSARGFKKRGLQRVELTWTGATSTKIDVFRGGVKLVTTANDGVWIDQLDTRKGGPYTYKVCDAATTTCSNSVLVSF